jgi:hypothetical protein
MKDLMKKALNSREVDEKANYGKRKLVNEDSRIIYTLEILRSVNKKHPSKKINQNPRKSQ